MLNIYNRFGELLFISPIIIIIIIIIIINFVQVSCRVTLACVANWGHRNINNKKYINK